MRVGVTAGSRGLANIPVILRAVGNEIRQRGGHPFIIPAMGSHGGATAAGQEEVLESYGITERTTAMPIVSAMDVQQIGQLPDGPTVYMSTTALEADALLIVGRVKPHTRLPRRHRERPGQDHDHRLGQAPRRADDPLLWHRRPEPLARPRRRR